MAQRWIVIISFVFVLATNALSAEASSVYHRQHYELNCIVNGAFLYHHEHHTWPVSDATGSWFDKLVSSNLVDPMNMRWGQSAAGEPLDMHGHPVIFDPPNPAHPDLVIVRLVGLNGRDDQGGLDDWEVCLNVVTGVISGEPNLGYWYKERWPAAYRRAGICFILAIVGIVLILRWIPSRALRWTFGLLWLRFFMAFALPFGFDTAWGSTTASVDPQWIMLVQLFGLMLLASAVTNALLCFWTLWRDRRWALAHPAGCCVRCQYDLRGLSGRDKCPECGAPIDTVTVVQLRRMEEATKQP